MTEIKDMEVSELTSIVNARLKAIEKRNQSEEAARKLEKQLKKN